MKVWVTKYALTEGIRELDVEIYEDTLSIVSYRGGYLVEYFHGEGKDWHKTEDAAKTRAEQMRVKKIQALKKSITRLEAIKF